jgi:general secretion pathway protein H
MSFYGPSTHRVNKRYPGRIYPSCSRGFTLLEILVVMIILGIAAGVTGLVINNSSGGVEIKKAAQEISATLRYARSRAISEKKSFYFAINNVSMTYGLYDFMVRAGEDEDLKHINLAHRLPKNIRQVKFNEAEHELFQIEFSALGSSSGGVMEIRDDSRRYVISVNRLTGRVKVEKAAL